MLARLKLLCLLFAAAVLAGDAEYCARQCARRFDAPLTANACHEGCAYRSNERGMYAFINCHRKCDQKFDNVTTDEGEACHFACQLPFFQSMLMTFNVNDDGTRSVNIKHFDADDTEHNVDSMVKTLFSDSMDLPRFPSSFEDIHKHMAELHESMMQPLDHMRIRDPFMEAEDSETPPIRAAGHMLYAQKDETKSSFWNMDTFVFIQYLLCEICLIALMIAFFVGFRLLRQRREQYNRLMTNVSCRPSTMSASAPAPLVKKVPIDDFENPPQEGAPPAYDQLSVSSVHKKVQPK